MNTRKRHAQSATTLTSSPYRNQLIEQERMKEEKGKGKRATENEIETTQEQKY